MACELDKVDLLSLCFESCGRTNIMLSEGDIGNIVGFLVGRSAKTIECTLKYNFIANIHTRKYSFNEYIASVFWTPSHPLKRWSSLSPRFFSSRKASSLETADAAVEAIRRKLLMSCDFLLSLISLVIVGTLHADEKMKSKIYTRPVHAYIITGRTISESRDLLRCQEKPVNGLQAITVDGSCHANAME